MIENESEEITEAGSGETVFAPATELSPLHAAIDQVLSEMKKVIYGQDDLLELMLIGLLSDGHVLIEGVPGIAKTLAAKLLARTIHTHFSRIQFTPDLMPSDILGTAVFNQKTGDFEFHKGPVFSNIILIDEINRAPAKTQAALFEVMEERQITIDGHTYKMDIPFFIIATQNPVEQEGTYRLPEAQLDRFIFKIEVDYPGLDDELKIVSEFHGKGNHIPIESVNAVLSPKLLKDCRELVANVTVENTLLKYIAQITHETRNNPDLMLGASPRASLAMLSAAKARAVIEGRTFVTPEDIKSLAPHVLMHRIMLTPEREMEGLRPIDIVSQILKKVEIPR